MGKKKAVTGSETPDKTRVELRFETEVYNGIKRLADEAEISVNQLMQGLAKWAMKNLKPGEPDKYSDGWIAGTRRQPGCLWAGEEGSYRYASEQHALEDDTEGADRIPGKVWLFLDYTERRVLRDDL